jgi:DNA-binding transcriptional MerR regulator
VGQLLPIGIVVEELRRQYPDVSHSSLRFLEREGLVHPMRTAGGHRLYTRDDVERIRQIKRWQAQRLLLREIRERLDQLDALPPLSHLTDQFLQWTLSGDLRRASRLILDAAETGLSIERIFGEILDPALQRVGKFWSEGLVLVAQEKDVSEVSRELIAELTLRRATATTGSTLVAAAVEGEQHELGLRMVCGLLRSHGYEVHFLGANVATRFLVESTCLHRPVAVLLSASLPEHLPIITDAIRQVRSSAITDAPPLVLVGGGIATSEAEAITAAGAIPLDESHLPSLMTTIMGLLPRPEQDDTTPTP